MKKILSTLSFVIAVGVTSQYANATLVNDSTLSFSPIASGGDFADLPADGLGSWFSMEVLPGIFTITPITSLNGLVLGSTQPASSITPVGGNIDIPWLFFGNMGTHQTLSNSNVLTASGDSATIDFDGWNITWNGIPGIDMSADAWNGNAEGVADVVCQGGSGCSNGASYILDFSSTTPNADPSGYGGVRYALHLEGTISTVPVPAAIWLFLSGTFGLFGFIHRPHHKFNLFSQK